MSAALCAPVSSFQKARSRNASTSARSPPPAAAPKAKGASEPARHAVGGKQLPEILRLTLWVIAALTMTVGNVLAVLQSNVKRVLARWFGIEGFPGEARVEAELWRRSESVTPADRAAVGTTARRNTSMSRRSSGLSTRNAPAASSASTMPG